MDTSRLESIVHRLVQEPKGILAIDESTKTCTERFEALRVPCTEETRRDYRELIITIPKLEDYVSGLIMVEETLSQKTRDGISLMEIINDKGMLAGIKVDEGLDVFPKNPHEKVTKGLESLPERLQKYKDMGALFTKWRSVYSIGSDTPSRDLMEENARRFAAYATLAQQHDLVPVVEPEVLMEGNHDIHACARVTGENLDIVFQMLREAGVYLPGMILKSNMVTSGATASVIASVAEVAKETIAVLADHVPETVGGIVFLSGGQYDEIATLHLEAMKEIPRNLPWPLTFSYGRAIQKPGLELWAQDRANNWRGAQQAILDRAKANSLASIGAYRG